MVGGLLQRMVRTPKLRGTTKNSCCSRVLISLECDRAADRDLCCRVEFDQAALYRPVTISQIRSTPGSIAGDNDLWNRLVRLAFELGSFFPYSITASVPGFSRWQN